MSIKEARISSSSRPRFEVLLTIKELSNIPQVSGSVFVRWYIKDSPKPDARGRTELALVKDHRTTWSYDAKFKVRIGINRSGVLKDCSASFDVIWIHSGNGRVQLGKVDINLSQYVGHDGTPHRHLLRNSKINSVLSIAVQMTQIKGSTEYRTPVLSLNNTFGDITGVISDQKEKEQSKFSDHPDSILSKLHHKTFAVSWDPQPGDLDPEACIENIFAGGDGFDETDNRLAKDEKNTNYSAPERDDYISRGKSGLRLMTEDDIRTSLRSWGLGTV